MDIGQADIYVACIKIHNYLDVEIHVVYRWREILADGTMMLFSTEHAPADVNVYKMTSNYCSAGGRLLGSYKMVR